MTRVHQTIKPSWKEKRNLCAFFIIFSLAVLISACTSSHYPTDLTLPCDEKIADPQVYTNIILANPTFEQLTRELKLTRMVLAPCFVDQTATVDLDYELPKSFSQYEFTYIHELWLKYHKGDSSLSLMNVYIPSSTAFDAEAILSLFQEKIHLVENNSRVQEFLTTIDFNPQQPISLSDTVIRGRNHEGEVSYASGLVAGYLLPNNRIWQEFPEIELAHKIIQENLFVGELSNCQIGSGEGHSYTTAQCAELDDNNSCSWYIKVAIICSNVSEEAFLKLYPDGSYERLSIENKYK